MFPQDDISYDRLCSLIMTQYQLSPKLGKLSKASGTTNYDAIDEDSES